VIAAAHWSAEAFSHTGKRHVVGADVGKVGPSPPPEVGDGGAVTGGGFVVGSGEGDGASPPPEVGDGGAVTGGGFVVGSGEGDGASPPPEVGDGGAVTGGGFVVGSGDGASPPPEDGVIGAQVVAFGPAMGVQLCEDQNKKVEHVNYRQGQIYKNTTKAKEDEEERLTCHFRKILEDLRCPMCNLQSDNCHIGNTY
jgi:hypothetical protein